MRLLIVHHHHQPSPRPRWGDSEAGTKFAPDAYCSALGPDGERDPWFRFLLCALEGTGNVRMGSWFSGTHFKPFALRL